MANCLAVRVFMFATANVVASGLTMKCGLTVASGLARRWSAERCPCSRCGVSDKPGWPPLGPLRSPTRGKPARHKSSASTTLSQPPHSKPARHSKPAHHRLFTRHGPPQSTHCPTMRPGIHRPGPRPLPRPNAPPKIHTTLQNGRRPAHATKRQAPAPAPDASAR